MNTKIEEEITEIKKRIMYLKNTDKISIAEKIAIITEALESLEKCISEKQAAR